MWSYEDLEQLQSDLSDFASDYPFAAAAASEVVRLIGDAMVDASPGIEDEDEDENEDEDESEDDPESAGSPGQRHFILAALPGGRGTRDVLMTAPDGSRAVLVAVPDPVAVDVLEAVRAAYSHGQLDLMEKTGDR